MQEKIKLTSKGQFFAEAVRTDGTLVRFSRTNSTWYEYNLPSRNVGDEWMVEVQISREGNPMIQRLNADKYSAVIKIENMLKQRDILLKQEASL